jgi:hypothetical protein
MSNFSFMKTGHAMTQTAPDDIPTEQEIIAIVCTFADEGLKHADRYVKHHVSREVITPEDVKRGMMLETFLYKNRPDLLERFTEIQTIIAEIEDEEYCNEEEEEDLPNIDDEGEFTINNCDCAICKCMTTIHERWNKWVPATQFDIILKNSIEKI